MAGRKKTETVEAEVVETAVVPAGKMKFRLINPTEDGFLRRIQWNNGPTSLNCLAVMRYRVILPLLFSRQSRKLRRKEQSRVRTGGN